MGDNYNFGFLLQLWRRRTPPCQDFLYLQDMTEKEQMCWAAKGYPEYRFSAKCVMGVNTIARLLPDLCLNAGLENWKEKTGHTLRSFGVTKLANDPSVNQNEVARYARHNSTAAQEAYIRPTEDAECNMIRSIMGLSAIPLGQDPQDFFVRGPAPSPPAVAAPVPPPPPPRRVYHQQYKVPSPPALMFPPPPHRVSQSQSQQHRQPMLHNLVPASQVRHHQQYDPQGYNSFEYGDEPEDCHVPQGSYGNNVNVFVSQEHFPPQRTIQNPYVRQGQRIPNSAPQQFRVIRNPYARSTNV
jgi:hypothetical protein